ncbi:MAG: dihydroneopterin aldolase [Rikenellaceae bacterium]
MKKGVIEIEGMEFYAFHGCYREEQIVGNRFMVDLTFETDVTRAAESDNIEDTISYLEVYNVVEREMKVTSHILEHVAQRIIDAVMERFYPEITHIKVKVSKCNPPLGGNIKKVSVLLES